MFDFYHSGPHWPFFIVSLTLLCLLRTLSLFSNLFLAFLVYLLSGGWRFVRILCLTGPRDIRGLKVLLSVKLLIWKMKRKGFTIPDLFEDTVERYNSKIAFMFEKETWSFIEINEYSNKVANYLLKRGVKPGDIIALFMESRPTYVATWVGISKIGAVPALINSNLRKESLIHCIKDANICGIICGMELANELNDVPDNIFDLKIFRIFVEAKKVTTGLSNGVIKNVLVKTSMDTLINMESNQKPPLLRHSTRKVSDPLMYIYTSGTTGLPKAAKVSHARFVMMSYGAGQMLSIKQSDVIYNPLPLYHTAGGMIGVGQVLICGVTMAIRKKFSASNFWKDCLTYQATVVQYIGEICRYLLAQPQKPEETQHKVRLAFGNGIRPQIWTEFQTRFHIPKIGEFYGATESNANIVNSVNKTGAVGFGTRILPCLYPITLIKIDPHSNEPLRKKNGFCIECQPGEIGELVGKIQDSDPLRQFDGYVNSIATNKKVVFNVFKHGDRAFLTGDLLMQDELGFFYFKDRLGDTFRWKGENVSTTEVEATISNCLQLNDCVVYGVEIPNNEGRAGMAAVVDTEKKIKSFSSLVEILHKSLPSYSRPVFIRLCQNIEMTGTFKLKKMDLVKEGFNPSCMEDMVYYFDGKSNDYLRLTAQVYEEVMKGLVRF